MSQMPTPVWQIRIDRNVYEADTPTLRAWIQEGRVLPTDLVKFGSGDWMPVSQVPQFRPASPAPVPPPPVAAPAVQSYVAPMVLDPLVFNQPIGGVTAFVSIGLLFVSVFTPLMQVEGSDSGISTYSLYGFLFGKFLCGTGCFAFVLAGLNLRRWMLLTGGGVVMSGIFQLFMLTTPLSGVSAFEEFNHWSGVMLTVPDISRIRLFWWTFGAVILSGVMMIQAGLIQSSSEGLLLGDTPLRYAGFWERAFAGILDVVWFGTFALVLLNVPVTYLVMNRNSVSPQVRGIIILCLLGVAVLLLVSMIVGCQRWFFATPGQMNRRIVILDAEKRRQVPPGRIVKRSAAAFLSLLPLGLGFLWSAFDKRKQTWHDKIAGTVMVHLD